MHQHLFLLLNNEHNANKHWIREREGTTRRRGEKKKSRNRSAREKRVERRAEWIHPVADQTSGSRAFLVSPLRRVSIIRGRGQSLPYGTVVDGTVPPLPSSPTALGLNQKLSIMGSGEEEGACSLDPAGPCPSPVSADKCEQVCGCPSFSLHRSQRSSVKGKTRSERERERKSDRGRRGGVERARRSRRLGEQNKGPRATDTYIKGRRTDGQTHTETLQRERERERGVVGKVA